MNKPFSPSCARNGAPILEVLRDLLGDGDRVLEIGSGTGQHAVLFGAALPSVIWQASDRAENLDGIRAWLDEAALGNLPPVLELDVSSGSWPDTVHDAVFTANTCHIMAWAEVEKMFAAVAAHLTPSGLFLVYGPFNRGGDYTSESNALFDAWLLGQGPHQGIRDLEALIVLGQEHGLQLESDLAMPANNQLLVFRRQA